MSWMSKLSQEEIVTQHCLLLMDMVFNKKVRRKVRCATRGREGGGLPCPFLKIKKKCHEFGKKGPDCVLG